MYLSNRYKKKAEEIAKLLKDQPMTGLEKAVWWTEYVIRNKGAPHLRNPGADMSWPEFLILDVVAFLVVIVAVTLVIFCKILCFLFRLLFGKQPQKLKAQ